MILTDAGPLIALVDRAEPDHGACTRALRSLAGPMLTTWPAFTEATYLLGSAGGWPGQAALWRMVSRGDLAIDVLGDAPLQMRVRDLMEQYQDVPMDLADASLVAVAEVRDLRRVFTLDRHFAAYRRADGKPFDVVPSGLAAR